MPNIIHKQPYDENGKRHGEWIHYYDNGQLWFLHNYFHGLAHGLDEGYFEDGKLIYSGYWNMGKRVGYWHYEYQPKYYYLWLI